MTDLPRFRRGHSVPENIYDMLAQPNKPIMVAPTPELAAEYVLLLNGALLTDSARIKLKATADGRDVVVVVGTSDGSVITEYTVNENVISDAGWIRL
jgi:hypothetical protein